MSRDKLIENQDEDIIEVAESMLGFGNIECSDFDMNFSRYSGGSHLSNKQLKNAMEALGLNGNAIDEPPLDVFLTPFLEGERGYSLKKLVCVGILLGRGTPEKKGELLMQNYDRDCSGEIDPEELKIMIDDMASISINASIEVAKGYDKSRANKLDVYQKKLKNSQKVLFIYIQFLMTMGKDNESIMRDKFIDMFKDAKMKKLASTRGVREIIMELNDIQYNET